MRPVRIFLTLLWILISSLLLTAWWMRHPAYFPPLPPAVWDMLSQWYQPTCCEGQADLEFIVGLVLAVSITAVTTAAILLGYSKIKGRAG
jgi:hypothetical protein